MRNIYIATSREVGERCIEWATNNTPSGFALTKDIDEADIVFSVMYNKILPSKVVNNKKCFNFHPGILPEYKGVGIGSWVIINGEEKTGVTLHLMDRGVDTGDIIEIREYMISRYDTAHSLFIKSQELIYKMFKNWYNDLLNGDYIAVPQKPNRGKVYRKRDLEKAMNLTRFAKAFHFPEKPPAFFLNDRLEKIYLHYTTRKEE